MSKFPKVAVLVWLALLGAASWSGWLTTPVRGDLSLFIPEARTPGERFFLAEFGRGTAARVVLMAVEGGTGVERAATSRRLARALRKSGLFARVENGEIGRPRPELGFLFPYRYLLTPQPSRLAAPALRRALQRRLAELASPIATFPKKWLPHDPTGAFQAYLLAARPSRQPRRRRGVWVAPDDGGALLLAVTHAAALEVHRQARAVATIEAAFQDAAVAEGGMTLRMSGAGVFAVRSRDTIQREVRLLTIFASLAVAGILLLLFRSLLLLVLGGLPLASAVVAGWGAVGAFYPGIHGITLAFGIILVGAAIDYPIHLFSQLQAGRDPCQTMRGIWPTLRLSWVTTCLAFSAMVTTDFTGLVQIGIFAAVGLAAAGLVTGWILPALIPAGWGPRFRAPLFFRASHSFSIPRWAAPAAAAAAVAFVLGTFLLQPVRWGHNLASLSPISPALLEADRTLRRQMAAPDVNHIIFITATDAQQALEKSEALAVSLTQMAADGLLGGFDMAARYLPSMRRQEERQRALPDETTLKAALARAGAGLPFRPGLFQPFLRDVAESRGLTPLGWKDLAGTSFGLRVQSLLFPGEGGWLAVVPLAGVREAAAVKARLAPLAGQGVHYLHLPSANRELMLRFRDETFLRVGLGAAVMVLLLLAVLRPLGRLWRVLLPVGLAGAVLVGILMWSGPPLNLFHLFSLLLTFGIGIDYCLFFSRLQPDPDTRLRTTQGLVVCLLSTVLMFGTLALSQVPILKVIGTTVGIGVALCFFFAVLFSRSAPKNIAHGPS